MSDGLTYDTRSQAEQVKDDYHKQGYLAKIQITPEGKYKVLIASGYKELPDEDIEMAMPSISEEDFEEELIKEERKEEVREAIRLPKEIKKRSLDMERKKLEQENERRLRLGMEAGKIVEVRDSKTLEVVGYKLETRGIEKTAAETAAKKVVTGALNAPIATTEMGKNVVEHMSGKIDVKKGMKKSIPGHFEEPKSVIAWIPSKPTDDQTIGVSRPSIGRMGRIDVSAITAPVASPLKFQPSAKPIMIDAIGKGFGNLPVVRKPDGYNEKYL